MQQTNINQFFEYLAERKYHENDLSDITYALCCANDEFRKFFLNFCFPKDNSELDTNDLTREYTNDRSRLDFFFHDKANPNQERLIEVKIFDKNTHKEYEKKFSKAKLAFIANYEIDIGDNWSTTTWKDFYNNLKNNPTLNGDNLVSGYLKYLESVTYIEVFKKMNLLMCTNLSLFYDNITCVAKELSFSTHNANSIDKDYYGRYFVANHNNKNIYFWLGTCLKQKAVLMGFYDEESWVPSDNLKIIKKNKKYININSSFADYWYEMPKEKYDVLCDGNEKEQKKTIKEFIISIFESIGAKDYIPNSITL
ncbi:MAG: hypothetical protein IKZ57_01170 [Spirochaetia bacterium]|nr:hypothetical protein [Spirochaetia bacterium]